ncbi:hypothetical protein GCM10009799_06850 [Nocardiopsis rhodophaea]|uniref:Anti-sigma factor antagonist n=1 Tax=Nocardiopsis rhodophaea TaxID=280238 RepID=A0ABP5DPG5_9ACTN
MTQQFSRSSVPGYTTTRVFAARPRTETIRTAALSDLPPVPALHPGANSMPALTITTRNHDDGLVIALDGEIDMATEDQFHQAVLDAVDPQAHGRVVLDCSRLGFIDSSGLRVLIQSHKIAREHDTSVFIAAPTDRVARLLHVTRINTRIPVFPTVDAALAAPLESPTG